MLAETLRAYADRGDVIVLALPRGGVPVGLAIAERLHVDLDVVVVRKLGVPSHEELAMGAVASGGMRVLNRDIVAGQLQQITCEAFARGIRHDGGRTLPRRVQHARLQCGSQVVFPRPSPSDRRACATRA